MKKLFGLMLLVCVLCFSTISYAAGTAGDVYQKYLSSYQKYVDALNANAPQEMLDALAEEYKKSLELYKSVSGKNLKSEEEKKDNVEGAISSEEAVSKAAKAQDEPLSDSPAKPKYDSMISALEKKISQKGVKSDQINSIKLQLAQLYASLRVDYKKAEQLSLEVANSASGSEIGTKAGRLAAEYKIMGQKQLYSRVMNAKKNEVKTAYTKFSNFNWLSSPVSKVKSLFSYYSSIVKYKKSLSEYHDVKEQLEELTQNQAVTDAEFDTLTDSEPLDGNDVTFLINGKCSFAKRHELISKARSYIYLQYLSYKNDETGNKLADALIGKAKAGLDVRVIIDYWTTFSYKQDIVYKLRAGGVKVALYNSPFKSPLRINNRNHQKVFIVDDAYGITGGMNIGDDYAKGSITVEGWRDTDVYLEGPVVMEMKQLFITNWDEADNQSIFVKSDEKQKYLDEQEFLSRDFKIDDSTMYKSSTNPLLIKEVLKDYYAEMPGVRNVDLRFISHYPLNKDDHVLEAMVWYVDRASREVILETPYFLPAKKLEDALVRASNRGVKVSVITNSMYSNDMGKYIVYASHYFFQRLIENNIKIYEWYGSQTLHAKCNYFDGVAVTVGSYNLNSRSHGLDAEELILVENAEFAQIMYDIFMKDLQYCREVTLDQAKEWNESFSEEMKMNLFHLVDGIF